ncbi:fumarylacetoacetate hydrolase family protein [Microbacterium sp. UCD-TDU]|uniref:fumarylacetoacetate hydrolase family protein n=1 Tax=Microbacterium sp. UCD-TDU TaxID=1247714 RepID=UPI0003475690|nr:fumarylacetoacetate hydrolase family protein [Microbacterium sp. UCD-TDU]EYT58432.1 2-keto-4-pentenoate hydratase [Microbacterium sp. UCD-TDU]
MRLGRIDTADGPRWVRETEEGLILLADPFVAFAEGRLPSDEGDAVDAAMIAPVDPVVIVGIAQNGPEHVSPVQAWLKSPRTVIGSGAEVVMRRDAGAQVAEGEIAVVIGRPTPGLTVHNAHEYVLGVTAVNDLSSPDRAAFDPRNFESKSGEGYTPLGPWIDTEVGIDDVSLEVEVDGRLVAETGSRQLPMSIRECLAYVAAWSPLGPGDVVMTGAPHSQTPVEPGQTVTVRVAGIELVTAFV